MLKLIPIIIEIVWTIIKGIAKQNEEEKAKRAKLKEEAAKAWSESNTVRAVDRMWAKLRR